MAIDTTTIRIPRSAKKVLDEMARHDHLSVQGELVRLIEDARRRRILAETQAAYDTMPAEIWNALDEERKAWDSTLGDGLERT